MNGREKQFRERALGKMSAPGRGQSKKKGLWASKIFMFKKSEEVLSSWSLLRNGGWGWE